MTKLPLADVSLGSVSPPMVVALAILTIAYARRSRTLAGQDRPLPRWRQICFYAAIFILIAEPLSPIGPDADVSFTSHMIEHLMIGDLAALLVVLGLTGPLIAPLLKLDLIAKLRVLAHPAVALPVWLVNLYVWHLPFMMEGALDHDIVHVAQHIMFFSAGLNMWMPLFGPLPQPAWFTNIAKLGYAVVVRLAGLLLGNVFVFAGSVFYDNYQRGDSFWNLSPAGDQSTAGAVMMIEGSIFTFGLLTWLFIKAARESDQSQELVELAGAHGIELSSQRSARAAAAGTTELLRQRIVAPSDQAGPDDGPPVDE
ncbi:MAG: cytochrome c oxidase assembly protein [Solirubrobacterales bacterium]